MHLTWDDKIVLEMSCNLFIAHSVDKNMYRTKAESSQSCTMHYLWFSFKMFVVFFFLLFLFNLSLLQFSFRIFLLKHQ